MEIVFIGLALSVCCFGIWRYGKTLRRGGCCGSGAVSPVKRRVADRDETHYPYTAVLTIDGMPYTAVLTIDGMSCYALMVGTGPSRPTN